MDDARPAPTIFAALWRYRWSSLVIVVATVLISLVVTVITGDGQAARARIVLKTPDQAVALGGEMTSESSFVRYVKQRALFVTSDRALNIARTKMADAEPLTDLREIITATASPSGESIEITVGGRDPERSVMIANAVIEAYQEQSRGDVAVATDKALQTLVAQRKGIADEGRGGGAAGSAAGQTLSELDKQITQIRVAASEFDDGVSFVDRASTGGGGPLSGMLRDGALGLVAGLVIAAALAWIRADRDRRVRDAKDVAGAVDEPLLGEIETVPAQELRGVGLPPLRSYRLVASGLRTIVSTGVVVVTGAATGAGVTTTTLQVAAAAARDGLRVLVVDAAVHSRELSRILGLGDWFGLTSIATGAASLDEATHSVQIGEGVFFNVVPAGGHQLHSREVLRSSLLEQAVADMRARYDLVLVDLPPLTSVPEITPLIRVSDGVVVTVRRNGDLDALKKLREQIHLFGGAITGYVLTFAGTSPGKRDAAEQPVG